MQINANFEERVVVHGGELAWKASPMKGVSRRMLERIGDEVARATTIVRYDEGSSFSSHVHDAGEEFIVLEGVFQDEHGDYPAGCYVRNPPTSEHTPRSDDGCVILVKLRQFDLDDRHQVRLDMADPALATSKPNEGVTRVELHRDAREHVFSETWAAGAEVTFEAEGGIEVFVLDGSLTEGDETLRRHAWLRLPIGQRLVAKAGNEGAKVWVKTGHLRFAPKA